MSERITHTIIPAEPGWQVATFFEVYGSGVPIDGRLCYEPVIAWAVKRDEEDDSYRVSPITLRGDPDDGGLNPWVLKSPDGAYLSGRDRYSDERAVIEELVETYRESMEAAKKALKSPPGSSAPPTEGSGLPQRGV